MKAERTSDEVCRSMTANRGMARRNLVRKIKNKKSNLGRFAELEEKRKGRMRAISNNNENNIYDEERRKQSEKSTGAEERKQENRKRTPLVRKREREKESQLDDKH